jgi:hypothetical protein
VFKSILISVTIVPILVGVMAAKGRDGGRDLAALRVGWVAYAVLWLGALYFLAYR